MCVYIFMFLFPIFKQKDLKNSRMWCQHRTCFEKDAFSKYFRKVTCWELYRVLRKGFFQLYSTCKLKDGGAKKTPQQICLAQSRSWMNSFQMDHLLLWARQQAQCETLILFQRIDTGTGSFCLKKKGMGEGKETGGIEGDDWKKLRPKYFCTRR